MHLTLLKKNGANITEPNEIAERFNKYFCSTGKKLAAKIDCLKSNNYLTNSMHFSMYVGPTSLFEILYIRKQLNFTKAVDWMELMLNLYN